MNAPTTFSELYEQLALRKVPFLMVFFAIMVVSYGLLFAVDFIPEAISEETKAERAAEESFLERVGDAVGRFNGGLVPQAATLPEDAAAEAEVEGMRVIIPDEPAPEATSFIDVTSESMAEAAFPVSISLDPLGRTVPVLNPQSRSYEALDEALLSGAVRHPDSADFSDPGNIFILAHSSYLPNVFNQNFQAFNGIQELTWGDTIRLNSENTEYVYQVDRVYKAKASAVEVPVTKGEAKLTLATCNSFASKDDRFIVEATLVETNIL